MMKIRVAMGILFAFSVSTTLALDIDNWSFTGDSLISDQGKAIGSQWEDGSQLVPDPPGDDARTLTPATTFFSAQTPLSSSVDLSVDPNVRLTIDYNELDFSTNSTANSQFAFRLWTYGAQTNWIALAIQDNFNNNKVFARFLRDGALGGSDANAGRLVNGLGPDSTPRTVVMDIDFSTGEILVSSPAWQWSSLGPTGVFTNNLPAITNWTTLDRFQTAFNAQSDGDTITIDNILVETIGEPEGVYIAAKGGAVYNNVPAEETVASFSSAEAGDMLVVTVASNQGQPRPDGSKITTGGTAGLEPFTHDFASVGASAHLWYAPVISDGTISVSYSKSNEYSVAGAYLLRSSTDAIEVLGTSKNSIGAGGALSLSNNYSFGSSVTGLYLEACASYDNAGITPLEPSVELDFGSGNRQLVSGDVAGTALQTIWTNTVVKNIAIMGAAFGAGEFVAPTGVNVLDASFLSIGLGTNGNGLGTFNVAEGDYVAVLLASNTDVLNTNDLVLSGTASLEPVAFDKRNNGPCGYIWYTKALGAGTVDMVVTTRTYSAVGAYQLGANSGSQLKVLDTAKVGSSAGDNITNSYSFGEVSTGLFLEAYGTYTADFAPLNPDYEKNVSEGGGDRRQVGRGAFYDVATLDNVWTNDGANQALIGIAFGSELIPTSPTEFYAAWIGAYAVGTDTNLQDDADGDLLDNLTEYAFGGEPDNIADQGNVPTQSQVEDGGTNYLEYIYFERDNKIALGLDSILEVGTDLVITNWADGSSYEVGSGASGISGFNAVTNRIPTDAEVKQFIRLLIEFTP